MERLRRPGRLALALIVLIGGCAWSALAFGEPPLEPGSEVIDPWAPPTLPSPHASRWSEPGGSELVDPWQGMKSTPAPEEPDVIDPWREHSARMPTAVFPPAEVIDPWSH